MGPTASGKTDRAIALAMQGSFEIINVDPAQMMRGMDIGSGKPDLATRRAVPHHLMDCLDPKEITSAGQFYAAAVKIMTDITARGKIPLLVGGTMMYFKALQQGLSPLPPASKEIRAQLAAIAKEKGWAYLYAKLQEIDPQTAAQIQQTDPQRIQRALEIYESSGKPPAYWRQQPPIRTPYHFVNIALMPLQDNRAVLHARIAERFDQMLSMGLIEEVRALWEYVDHQADLPAMRAVGYRQVIPYLQGIEDYATMREKAIAATRQLAKRQLTWLRSWENTLQMDFEDQQPLMSILQAEKTLKAVEWGAALAF